MPSARLLRWPFPSIYSTKSDLILSARTLNRSRKWAILLIFVAAAVISPGDAISATFALAIPLYLLYEIRSDPQRTDAEPVAEMGHPADFRRGGSHLPGRCHQRDFCVGHSPLSTLRNPI